MVFSNVIISVGIIYHAGGMHANKMWFFNMSQGWLNVLWLLEKGVNCLIQALMWELQIESNVLLQAGHFQSSSCLISLCI